jgi:hypothetical protein
MTKLTRAYLKKIPQKCGSKWQLHNSVIFPLQAKSQQIQSGIGLVPILTADHQMLIGIVDHFHNKVLFKCLRIMNRPTTVMQFNFVPRVHFTCCIHQQLITMHGNCEIFFFNF